jgi:hypothetical protein
LNGCEQGRCCGFGAHDARAEGQAGEAGCVERFDIPVTPAAFGADCQSDIISICHRPGLLLPAGRLWFRVQRKTEALSRNIFQVIDPEHFRYAGAAALFSCFNDNALPALKTFLQFCTFEFQGAAYNDETRCAELDTFLQYRFNFFTAAGGLYDVHPLGHLPIHRCMGFDLNRRVLSRQLFNPAKKFATLTIKQDHLLTCRQAHDAAQVVRLI